MAALKAKVEKAKTLLATGKGEAIFTIIKAVAIALVLGAIIIAAVGANPLTVYKNIFIDPFSDVRHMGNIIGAMS